MKTISRLLPSDADYPPKREAPSRDQLRCDSYYRCQCSESSYSFWGQSSLPSPSKLTPHNLLIYALVGTPLHAVCMFLTKYIKIYSSLTYTHCKCPPCSTIQAASSEMSKRILSQPTHNCPNPPQCTIQAVCSSPGYLLSHKVHIPAPVHLNSQYSLHVPHQIMLTQANGKNCHVYTY